MAGALRLVTLRRSSFAILAVLVAGILIGVFAGVLARYRTTLREEVRRTIIERDAAVLRPVALRQLAQGEAARSNAEEPADLFGAVLESAQQEGMLAVAVFDAAGQTLRFVPDTLLFPELGFEDYLRLLRGETISRFHPRFSLARYFSGGSKEPAPVLEVLLPLHGRDAEQTLGFAQYYIDARPLDRELAAVERRISRLTLATLAVGAALIAGVVTAAYLGLRRAASLVEERNARLVRANLELSLAAKASAIGQIASHLVHGLQGSLAGLRAVVAGRANSAESASKDWATAASYAERMQTTIAEAVALLADSGTDAVFELSGHELIEIIRQRGQAAAEEKGVELQVLGGFDVEIDGHRGGLLCLIASNLVQNAIEATEPGRAVAVSLHAAEGDMILTVVDEGHGIPGELRPHLFEPGRSGRSTGSGLGLAISQLLARQLDGTLTLESTGPTGTTFRATMPLVGEATPAARSRA